MMTRILLVALPVAFLTSACATGQVLGPAVQEHATRLASAKEWQGSWTDTGGRGGGKIAFRFTLANNRLTGELVDTSGSNVAPNLGALRHISLKNGTGITFTTPVGVGYDLVWQPDGCLAGQGMLPPQGEGFQPSVIRVRVCPAG
jgi:hypothetical protein